MTIKKQKIVYSVTIDYSYREKQKGRILSSSLSRNSDEISSKVEQIARKVIEDQLPNELRDIFELRIQTRILASRDGSIILFFEVILGTFNFIAGYKGFYESAQLIRNQCHRLIASRLSREIGEEFDVRVEGQYPSLPDREEHAIMHLFHRLGLARNPDDPFQEPAELHLHRDAFFFYLLISNFILVTVIVLLVYGAVVKTYFPESSSSTKVDTKITIVRDTVTVIDTSANKVTHSKRHLNTK